MVEKVFEDELLQHQYAVFVPPNSAALKPNAKPLIVRDFWLTLNGF
jgi:hypothetical protein